MGMLIWARSKKGGDKKGVKTQESLRFFTFFGFFNI